MSTPLKSSPALRKSLQASSETPADGLTLATHEIMRFTDPVAFSRALRQQKEATTLIPADVLRGISDNGQITGTRMRLTEDAFSDLCHLTKTPVSFIKTLANHNPGLALDAVREMTNAYFSGSDHRLVLDERSGLVSGIVDESYTQLPTVDMLDWTMSTEDYDLTNGWIAGPNARFTLVSPKSEIEPRKGDIVRHGFSVSNAINGDAHAELNVYFERLVCTNGAIRRDSQGAIKVRHAGDASSYVQKGIVALSDKATYANTLMHAAANHMMLARQVSAVRNWIRDPGQGGGMKLDAAVVKQAKIEAKSEGRAEEEVTLYNFVNGINAQAHHAASLNKRSHLEAMAWNALAKFTPEFCNA